MEDTTETTEVSKLKQILGRTVRWMGRFKRMIRRGMYNRKGKLRLAVNFGYFREIDEANDVGSRLTSCPKAG